MHVLPLLLFFVLIYLTLIASFYLFQERFLFRPRTLQADYRFDFADPFKEHFIEMPDGGRIHALHFTAPAPSRGVVLYFHGNAGHLGRWGRYSTDFTRRDYDLFIFDYRGFGKSTGPFHAEAFHSDAACLYEWLCRLYPPDRIVLYGRSLGTGIASALATKVKIKCLILETPYDTLYHAIRVRFPWLWLPFPLRYPFENIRHIPLVQCPVYIFHGTRDELIRLKSARKLKSLLRNNGKFYIIRGGYHKNLPDFETYQQALDEILE